MTANQGRVVLGALLMTIFVISSAWTTWKARRILRKSLHRKIRPGEETSLKTWMTLSDAELAKASQDLTRASAFAQGLAGTPTASDIIDLDLGDHIEDGHPPTKTDRPPPRG